MARLLAMAIGLLLPAIAGAAALGPTDPPVPPRRVDAVGPPPAPTPSQAVHNPPMAPAPASPEPRPADTADDSAVCDRLLASGKVEAGLLPPITGPEGCRLAAPLRLAAIRGLTGARIALEPPVTVRCSFADGFADWVREDLAPVLASRGGGLAALTGTNGYECRSRNRVPGAKLSEHATGNAIDIRAFVLADRTVADITKTAHDPVFFAQVKLTACARFMTILGPGSDNYHEDNLHLDFQYRKNGAVYCHWQLP